MRMGKGRQREISAFRQGQVDRLSIENHYPDYVSIPDSKMKRDRNWFLWKLMKKLYRKRFPTRRASNMFGSYWFNGFNHPREKNRSL
jgi:hypothetical protein